MEYTDAMLKVDMAVADGKAIKLLREELDATRRLVVALVRKAGGQIRLPEIAFHAVNPGERFSIVSDIQTSELRLIAD